MFTVQFTIALESSNNALAWPCTRKGYLRLTSNPFDADRCGSQDVACELALAVMDSHDNIISAEIVPFGGCYVTA